MAVQVKFDRSKTYSQAMTAAATNHGTIYFTTDTQEIIMYDPTAPTPGPETYGGGFVPITTANSGLQIGSYPVLGSTTNVYVPIATTSSLGVVQLGYTTSGTDYAIEIDNSGKLHVNVPWTDTKYALTLNGTSKGTTGGTDLGTFYAPTTAGTADYYLKSSGSGAPVWAQFPSIPAAANNGVLKFKSGTTEVASFTADSSSDVTLTFEAGSNITLTPDATNKKITIANNYSYSLPTASNSTLGGVKLVSDNDATGTAAIQPASGAVSDRLYAVQLNSNDQMVVYVPWVQGTTSWEGE